MEIIIPIVSVVIVIVFLIWFKKDSEKTQQETLKNIYNETLNEALVKVTDLAKNSIKGEKEVISTDLKNKKEAIENIVKKIEQDLEKRHKELIDYRNEGTQYFADVKRQIQEHQKITSELRTSSEKLARILSSNQIRGEWGERILEDILTSAGLEKGIHYVTQEVLTGGTRPDVVILLPGKKKISIDAKFPLSSILKMNETDDKSTITTLKKQFETDVKTKIRDIGKREYINDQEGTLDFAIMFVPNEVVFSYINKEFPALIEEAFSKKIIITSPFSIYAIARTIMQGYRNYYYEQNLKEVLTHITSLKDQFGKFGEEFEKLGRSFDTVYKDFGQLSDTRFKMLNKAFDKIEKSERQTKEIKPTSHSLLEE